MMMSSVSASALVPSGPAVKAFAKSAGRTFDNAARVKKPLTETSTRGAAIAFPVYAGATAVVGSALVVGSSMDQKTVTTKGDSHNEKRRFDPLLYGMYR